MNFFEKISVFPFYPVNFRLFFPFPTRGLPSIYYFNYNFYFFPFSSGKIRPQLSHESVFFAFLPFPFTTSHYLRGKLLTGFFTRVNRLTNAFASKGTRGYR